MPSIYCSTSHTRMSIFTSRVDPLDHNCSTNACKKKGLWVNIELFRFLLDVAAHNSYTTYNILHCPHSTLTITTLTEFKREVASTFVFQSLRTRATQPHNMSETGDTLRSMECAIPSELSTHVFIMKDGASHKACYFCKLCATGSADKVGSSKYTCIQCKLSFHPECFMFYHRSDAFKSSRPDIFALVEEAFKTERGKGRRRRLRRNPGELSDASVPILKSRNRTSLRSGNSSSK